MMEFQELRVLLAVVDHGGFQRASKALHLTQSAVSQSLANLERKVGEKLIERTAPARPTPVGLELVRHARLILEREREFTKDLNKLKLGHLQKLELTVDSLVNKYYVPAAVKATLKKLPEMSVKIRRLPAREMIPAVLTGQFELGFGPFQKNMEGLKCYKLWEETSYLVTSRENPHFKLYANDPLLFLRSTVLLASSLDEPALRPSKTKIRDFFKGAWEADTISLQIQLLSEGMGATYMPKSILDQDPAAKRFVILSEIPFYKVTKPYGVYHRVTDALSGPATEFLQQAKRG